MPESLKILHRLQTCAGFPCGLATVTATEGSSYRRPGARMLLHHSGEKFGSISGGCLEEDMVAHLEGVMASGRPKTLIYDTTQENELVWGVGLGCNGKVTLLLERLESSPASLSFAQATADQRRVACVLAAVYQSDGDAGLGTCLGIAGDGSRWQQGIPRGLGILDHATTAGLALERRRSLSLIFNHLPGNPAVFFEYIAPTPRLLVLGAGDDAQPLVDAASKLGWSVIVADPRSAFATPARFPAAREVLVIKPDTLKAHVTLDDHTFAVVMTHHYVHDLPFLGQLIGQPLAYLGLLGPKKRAERLLQELRTMGRNVSPEALSKFHAPVGLDLGGDAPEAVALSMLAEMQAVLHQRDAAPLRLRQQPIHDSMQAGPT